MSEIILKLEDVAPELFVEIKGEKYPILTYDDFSLKDNIKLRRLAKMVQETSGSLNAESTEKDAEEAESALNEFVKMVLPAIPDELLARLPYGQKSKILLSFYKAVTKRLKTAAKEMENTEAREQ